jgi:hypothetical protein
MKYWQKINSDPIRVIAVNELVMMCSCWKEITKEEFDLIRGN